MVRKQIGFSAYHAAICYRGAARWWKLAAKISTNEHLPIVHERKTCFGQSTAASTDENDRARLVVRASDRWQSVRHQTIYNCNTSPSQSCISYRLYMRYMSTVNPVSPSLCDGRLLIPGHGVHLFECAGKSYLWPMIWENFVRCLAELISQLQFRL